MSKNENEPKNNVITISRKPVVNEPAGASVTEIETGALLLAALSDRAHQLGQDDAALAKELSVTWGFMTQLRKGLRAVNNISDEFAEACARYLQVPRLQVLMMAERIKPHDYFNGRDLYEQDVDRAIRFIASDNVWGPMVSAELRSCSSDTLFGVVRMYEVATGTKLMPNRVEVSALAEQVAQSGRLCSEGGSD